MTTKGKPSFLSLIGLLALFGSLGTVLVLQNKSTTPNQSAAAGTVIFQANFDSNAVGKYTLTQMKADFKNPPWEDGVSEGRVTVVDGSNGTFAYSGKSLRVFYPKGKTSSAGSVNIPVLLGKSYNDLTLSYRVLFPSGFDFVREGKLLGLCGGTCNSGGDKPTGKDGWSSRVLWRLLPASGNKPNALAQYIYWPGQAGSDGDMNAWTKTGSPALFKTGVWHQVQTRVKINTPGVADGIIQSWLDGVLSYENTKVKFRDVSTFAIDSFRFETFFGGSGSTFAPTKDEYAYFDDIIVSEASTTATPSVTPVPTVKPTASPTPVASISPTNQPTGTLSVSAKIVSDWNTGYCAEIQATNLSKTKITSWKATLYLHDSKMKNFWDGKFTKIDDTTYKVDPIGSRLTIDPGKTSNVGFCTTKTGTNYVPTAALLQ